MSQSSQQKYVRSKLSSNQITLLQLVYRYRFMSRQLVADSLGIAASPSLYRRLEVLVDKNILGKRYDKKLKLAGIPAAYYLTPQGMSVLRDQAEDMGITDAIIKAAYIDKRVGQAFINRTLDLHSATHILQDQYKGLKVFTKRQLSQYESFPQQLPDAFLSLTIKSEEQPRRFFLDFISDNTPRSSVDYRIAQYCKFFDDGGWDEADSELPTLLFISESPAGQKRLRRLITLQLYKSDMQGELTIYMTSLNSLKALSTEKHNIWMDVEDSEESVDLVG